MKNGKKTVSTILTLLLASISVLSLTKLTASAQSLTIDDKRTVRVGFFEFEGYHQMDENGSLSGYGYDFLQMIAPYAGFEYEYIGYDKSWAEAQEMLERGEIDLLTSAHMSSARLEKFDFSNHAIGYSSTMLTTLPTNDRYLTSDYSTFDGMRVGMMFNNTRNDSFYNYALKNGFHYEPVYYESQEEMLRALSLGEIDTMVTSDLRIIGAEAILDKFDEEGFYAIVKKGDAELLDRLNYGISELNMHSPSWINILSERYYNHNTANGRLSFTGREKEYLDSLYQNNVKLKILLKPERAPYSYFENGQPRGIFADLLETIASRYGLPYEVIETQNLEEYLEFIQNGVPDLLFDCTFDYRRAELEGYYLTGIYHTAQFCCVKRDDGPETPAKLAMLSGFAELNEKFDNFYNGRDIQEYSALKDCMQAVLAKKADATYAYVYSALKYVSEDSTGILIYTPVNGISTDFAIGVNKHCDPALYAVMNQIASNIGENDIQNAISKNTKFVANSNPVIYFIYHNPVAFAGIIASVIAAALIAVMLKMDLDKQRETSHANALKEAYDAASQANRAKSVFLSNVSHDIRTPMNAIIGMTAIAEAHIDDPLKVSECLSKITVSSRHLLSLINGVLDMSKIESGKVTLSAEAFDIADLLDNLLGIVSPQANEKQHELIVHTEQLKHRNAIGDSLRIQQVFINIVSNAIKYTPAGGKIQIDALELESEKPGFADYRFVFKDNGIGMSPEYLRQIFEPFSREADTSGDKENQGTGLGMAISKNIISIMGGTINVESKQGVGSTFTVTLSLKLPEKAPSPDDPLKTSSAVAELKQTDYTGKRILVAEDLEINQTIIREILTVTGIEVCSAENGKLALDKFAASPVGFYDMIFMDIRMPEMNGYDAAMAIRALDREDAGTIPIIALTANAFAEDIERALSAGMNGHLAKPLEMPKLISTLREWLN